MALVGRLWARAGAFPNLRSSAEIDLNEQFPQHVVANWLGHLESSTVKHNLRTKEEHFQQAVQNPAYGVDEAVQKTTQQVAATDGTEQKSVHKKIETFEIL